MTTELEKIFDGKGEVKDFKFTQIESNKVGYIYMVSTGNECHYEVFEKKKTPLCIDFETREYSNSDFRVKYPKAKDFGVWAWTYNSIDEAKERYKTLCVRYRYDIYSERSESVEAWTGIFKTKEDAEKWYDVHGKADELKGKVFIGKVFDPFVGNGKWREFYTTKELTN